jgi:hypothetical protein
MTVGMTPEEFQNYLGLLSRLLRLKATECKAIEAELRSHLEERLAALTAEGVEQARAVSMALAEFGDAAALAAEFTAVSRLYERRWIMRFSIGSIAASILVAALIIGYWPGGPVQLTQNTAQAQPAENTREIPPALGRVTLDANAETQAKLEKLSSIEFVEIPLGQVVDKLSETTNIQFLLDRRVLEEAGITTDSPITFKLKGVPVEMLLRMILRDLGLTYYLDNGVVIITTPEEAEARLETRVYRVDDLVVTRSANQFVGGMPGAATDENNPINVDYGCLIEVITTTIKPSTWDAVGGPGSIAPYRGTLCISQTAEVHGEIKKLLEDLRQSINKDIVDDFSPKSDRAVGRGGGMMGGRGGRMSGDMRGMGISVPPIKEGTKEKEKPASESKK